MAVIRSRVKDKRKIQQNENALSIFAQNVVLLLDPLKHEELSLKH